MLSANSGGRNGTRSTSAAVTTATTPGDDDAPEVSTDLSRAWATVERTKAMWAAPATTMSAA